MCHACYFLNARERFEEEDYHLKNDKTTCIAVKTMLVDKTILVDTKII